VCDLETSRIGAPYICDISSLRVNERQSKTRLKLICAIAGVEEADSLATYSHPHSSEPGKKRFETMALK
jgi:hypothetical protein